jgi:flavodoxin
METCIVYFSRTGNTKLMAEAIADAVKAPIFDASSSDPSIVEKYDLLILGTPVEGFRPTKEIMAFIEPFSKTEGKKAILFCTYALWRGSTFRTLSKALSKKGYETILNVSKKKVKPGETDFSDNVAEIRKALEK